MNPVEIALREILARHTHREPSAILPGLHLERDLHLRPLELVLVALDVEEMAGIEVPLRELASKSSVGELFTFLSNLVFHRATRLEMYTSMRARN